MPEVFYSRLASLIFRLCFLLALAIATIEISIFWLSTGNTILYYCFLALVASIFYVSIRFVLMYQSFQDDLKQGFLFSKANNENKQESENSKIDSEDDIPPEAALRTCFYYSRGASYVQIATDMHFSNAMKAMRSVRKGIKILLKEHKENGKKDT